MQKYTHLPSEEELKVKLAWLSSSIFMVKVLYVGKMHSAGERSSWAVLGGSSGNS